MLSNRAWWVSGTLLVLLTLGLGLPRIGSVPLDSHEIFVAGTARNMSIRNDWILPWFNGEPRLNKPPMSYWAAAGVAALARDLPNVEAWHVRLVSVLGGSMLMLSTLALGALLFDRTTALVAGGLLLGSAGLFSFMHDGRPDMLYAAFCNLMLLGFAKCAIAQASPAVHRPGWWALAWMACAAAILTKGPQLPLFMLLGLAFFLWRNRDVRWKSLASLRLVPGLLLTGLLCLPWWWALGERLSSLAVESSQLGGSLLVPSLAHLGEFYYAWRPLQLLLPWLPLVVLASVFASRNREARASLGFLWTPLLASAVALSLGRQYRYFYLLPLLGPMALLIARPLVCSLAGTERWALGTRLAFWVQGLLLLACAGWVVSARGQHGLWIAALLIAGLCLALCSARTLREHRVLQVTLALAVFMGSVWTAAAVTGRLWNEERYRSHALAREAARLVDRGIPLATLGVSPTLYAYYAARDVPQVESMTQLQTVLTSAPDGMTALVIPASRLDSLKKSHELKTIEVFPRRGDGEMLVLIREIQPP